MKIKPPQLSSMPKLFLHAVKIAVMYISIFMLFFLDSGFYPVHNMSGTIIIMINIASVIGLIVTSGSTLKIKRRLFFIYSAIVAVIIVSGAYFQSSKKTTILVICITVGFVISNFLEYRHFKKILKEMMLFLSVFSLTTLFLWIYFPSVIEALPIAKQTTANYHNAIFSIVSTSTYSTRNIGMFWEPGAFAIFLNIALLYEMTDKNQNIIKMLIFMITIVTTLSTLGVVCLVNLIAVYLFNKGDKSKRSKRNKVIIFLIAVSAIVYVFFNGEYFIEHVFGKLTKTFDGKAHLSTQTRINAIKYPLEAFMEAPVFGVGYNEFTRISQEYCDSMATCTFLNWLAIYGVFGLPLVIWCTNTFLRHGKTFIAKLGLFVFSVLLFSTESFLQIGFVYIFVFYGAQKNTSQSFSDL